MQQHDLRKPVKRRPTISIDIAETTKAEHDSLPGTFIPDWPCRAMRRRRVGACYRSARSAAISISSGRAASAAAAGDSGRRSVTRWATFSKLPTRTGA